MAKFKLTVQAEIEIEFDENSPEFKEMWDGYRTYIDSNADHESLCENIASLISRYGVDEFIEGVGYVKLNGENQRIFKDGEYKEQTGIVNVVVDTDINDRVDFYIDYIEEQ
jgi:hypothetical protein